MDERSFIIVKKGSHFEMSQIFKEYLYRFVFDVELKELKKKDIFVRRITADDIKMISALNRISLDSFFAYDKECDLPLEIEHGKSATVDKGRKRASKLSEVEQLKLEKEDACSFLNTLKESDYICVFDVPNVNTEIDVIYFYSRLVAHRSFGLEQEDAHALAFKEHLLGKDLTNY